MCTDLYFIKLLVQYSYILVRCKYTGSERFWCSDDKCIILVLIRVLAPARVAHEVKVHFRPLVQVQHVMHVRRNLGSTAMSVDSAAPGTSQLSPLQIALLEKNTSFGGRTPLLDPKRCSTLVSLHNVLVCEN